MNPARQGVETDEKTDSKNIRSDCLSRRHKTFEHFHTRHAAGFRSTSSQAAAHSILSMTGSEELHLSQRALAEKETDDALEKKRLEKLDKSLENLNTFLQSVKFAQDNNGLEYCSHGGLKEAARPFLDVSGFQDKVTFLAR
jgi:hypothetical protein